MTGDDTMMDTLVIVFAVVVVAPLVADRVARFVPIPSVVLEIVLGVLIGPQVLGWAQEGRLVTFVADLGLAMLMFLAGYEIEFSRIKGRPLKLAGIGWLCSLALGLAFGLAVHGFTFGSLVTGLALTTTALGTILPIVRDRGLLGTRLGPRVLAVGGFGEFGPIIAIALLLSGQAPERSGLLLSAFAVVAVIAVWLALRPRSEWIGRLVTITLGTSVQLAIRFAVFVIVAMLWVAYELGLDVLLGAFVAGIVVRLALNTDDPREAEVVQSKLEAIAFGMVVPFFFVVTGIRFDLRALLADPMALALVPVFVGLFFVVRGLPILLLHRDDLDRRDTRRLALLGSTALPIVVALTTIGTQTGVMAAGTAAALVGASMVTVLVFPLLAVRGLSPAGGGSADDPDLEAPRRAAD
ncbi:MULTISPECIES: cation:proton antiporter [unclassified Saccharothrix]|uniref:cation:proton antiporter n=1 Tax=unclassified Saccharothrix TaxID=2593673 RepID=UPI00307E4E3D